MGEWEIKTCRFCGGKGSGINPELGIGECMACGGTGFDPEAQEIENLTEATASRG